jgi:predicted NBD/HSP70 family sugar kinase
MNKPRTATTKVVTEINRTAILDALRVEGPLSRASIGRHTGLSPATVERLCSALVEAGLVVVDGHERSSGGRPSILYRYSGESRVVGAIDVSEHQVRGRLVNFDGKVITEDVIRFDFAVPDAPADVRLAGTLDVADKLLAAAKRLSKPYAGLGVAVPGLVHGSDGRVANTIELGWNDVALGAIIQSRTGLPVLIENDANAIGFGEWSQGAGRGAHSVVAYVLGVGVGAGIVYDGALLRGARSAAGEIGFLVTERAHLARPYTTQGDLESRVLGIARQFASGHGAGEEDAFAALFDAAAAGTPEAMEPASEVLDYISLACIALCTVLDPEVIVLAGHLSDKPDYVAGEIAKRIVGRIAYPPRIEVSRLGSDAALIGIAQLTIARARSATYLS